MTEEERAELYRTQLRSRAQARCDRFVALAGNRERREGLDRAWAPVVLARLEAQAGGVDPCDDALECVYCDVPDADFYISQIPDELLV